MAKGFEACFRGIWEMWAGMLSPWSLPWHSWYVGCPAGHADALTKLSSCAAVSEHWCALCAAQGQLHMRSDICFAQTGKLGLWDLAFAVTIDAGLVIAMFGNHMPHLPAAVTALGAASMQQLAAGPPFRKPARSQTGQLSLRTPRLGKLWQSPWWLRVSHAVKEVLEPCP